MKRVNPKREQEYKARPSYPACKSCRFVLRESKTFASPGRGVTWQAVVPSKCGIGGFDINPKGYCRLWEQE